MQQLLAHLADQGIDSADAVSREHIEDFIAKLLETRSAATANNRFRALQQFFKWLEAEDYVDVNPMAKMRPPAVPEQPVPVIDLTDIQAVLKTCSTKSFEGSARRGDHPTTQRHRHPSRRVGGLVGGRREARR